MVQILDGIEGERERKGKKSKTIQEKINYILIKYQ